MSFPKKIKKHLPLSPERTLYSRREELLEMINQDGTYLPKSILHSDLDRGFLDFVKEDLRCVVEGKTIPTVDVIITNQNWSQYLETWSFTNKDLNAEPPFITTVRIPEVKYGTNPAVLWNIPNRRMYFYASVPTWDGQRKGMDIYKIPQPVPVDITYQVKIVCNRMRELNKFNQIVVSKFSSRQAYRNIKGHYIPIVMNEITDESISDIDKRKYYVQSYSFTMLGFLIDEDEFEVSPAISRVVQVLEIDEGKKKKTTVEKEPENKDQFDYGILYPIGNFSKSEKINYTANFFPIKVENVTSYDVYINDNYYGSDISEIQVNTGDTLKIEVTKLDNTKVSIIKFTNKLL